jgi:hypothetical protein
MPQQCQINNLKVLMEEDPLLLIQDTNQRILNLSKIWVN